MYLFELVFSFFYNRSEIAGSYGDSLVAQLVKNLPAMQETWVQLLGREDPLEKKWQPTLVFLPGKSHGQSCLAGYSPWGHKESDLTEQLSTHTQTVAHQAPRPWDSPGKSTGVGCHALLRGIFPTQGSNPGVLYYRLILYQLSYQVSPGQDVKCSIS